MKADSMTIDHVSASPRTVSERLLPSTAIDSVMSGREFVAVGVIVAAADATIYRGSGFFGLGTFLAVATTALWLGRDRSNHRSGRVASARAVWTLALLMLPLVLRQLWDGSALGVVVGFTLLAALAVSLSGRVPTWHAVVQITFPALVFGTLNLWDSLVDRKRRATQRLLLPGAAFFLPLMAILIFAGLFVLANPDVFALLSGRVERFLDSLRIWIRQFTWQPSRWLFWLACAGCAAGLLRPWMARDPAHAGQGALDGELKTKQQDAPLYAACRNTLLAVIGLFAVYLVFEWATLWFREFPKGFYYAGYAHQGAAWLTIALGLATVTLSLIFTAPVRSDSRVQRLKRLAWIWSFQNLLLSLAVYNRLFIYIGFNGMTKMRIIGLFGISLVVVGFLLVVWAIARGRCFRWLLQRQSWALVLALYVYSLCPVDALAAAYNVKRIQQGQPSACMQIGVQPLDVAGKVAILPLLDSPSPVVRRGAAALIASEMQRFEVNDRSRSHRHWTARQIGRDRARQQFEAARAKWDIFADHEEHRRAAQEFHQHAYQWY